MTREEFLKKQNPYNIPGYTTWEVEKLKYDNEVKVEQCPVCNHPVLSCHICSMCGCDNAIGMVPRGERYLYLKHLEADPDYIWEVACYQKDRKEPEITLPQDEEIHIKDILLDEFGTLPKELDTGKIRSLDYLFNKCDVSSEAEFVYKSDIVALVHRLKEIVGNDSSLAVKALGLCSWKYDDLIHYLKDNPTAGAESFLAFLTTSENERK